MVKLRVERDALTATLKAVLPAVEARAHLPVLSCVRITPNHQSVELCCTSLALSIAASVGADSRPGDPVVVPAVLLARIVAVMPSGAVELEAIDNERLSVSCGETVATLRTFPADQWPLDRVVEGETVTLGGRDLSQLARIVGMASSDEKRPTLCGVHIAERQAMCTDSYRAGIVSLEATVPGEALVPAEALSLVLRAADGPLALTVGTKAAQFASEDVMWTTALIEEEYPVDHMRTCMRPASLHHWTFSTRSLADEVTRAMTVSPDKAGNPVAVSVEDGKALLHRVAEFDAAEISGTVPVDSDWDSRLKFNPVFLTQLLDAAAADEVTLEIEHERTWVVVRTEGLEQMLCLVARP